jgi:hypothetical protein
MKKMYDVDDAFSSFHCCLANLRIMSAGYRNHFDNFSVNSSQTLYLKGFSRKS